MAAGAAIPRGTYVMSTENGGFSVADRDTLTTVKVQLGYLLSRSDETLVRVAKLEESRLTARDMEELMSDTDSLRSEGAAIAKRVAVLEEWRTKVVAAALVVGAIAGFLARLIK